MSDPSARPREAGPERNTQALPHRAKIRAESPIVGTGAGNGLNGHHECVTAIEHQNTIPLWQLVFKIIGNPTRID